MCIRDRVTFENCCIDVSGLQVDPTYLLKHSTENMLSSKATEYVFKYTRSCYRMGEHIGINVGTMYRKKMMSAHEKKYT